MITERTIPVCTVVVNCNMVCYKRGSSVEPDSELSFLAGLSLSRIVKLFIVLQYITCKSAEHSTSLADVEMM